ncbi:MAG: acyl-CoA thioesterase [Actinobacteria bacterium]|nr:acyl-CoA thioesterase [Actinomycetota bacterium]
MIDHTERMRVNWVDTDASGRIHYTAALRYFEVAEHGLMRRLLADVSSRTFGLPRVHVEADYRRPLRYPDEFDCRVWIERVGESSVGYAYEIRNLADEVCIRGRIVAVAVGGEGHKIPLPDDVRTRLEAAAAKSSPRDG